MKILQRYVVRELWLPFLMSFLTLNFIFMGGYLVKAANFIVGRGVPFTDTLYVLLLALPDMVSYTVPTSLLAAVLIVFGNLAQNNEIRAIKASGIHPGTIMLPIFLIGLGASVLMFVFNDQVTTNAGFTLRRTTKQMLIRHPQAVIEPGRFVKLSNNIIFLAKEMHGDKMKGIVAYETEAEDKPVRTIMAERGEIVSNASRTEVKIRLYDGSVSDAEDSRVQSIQFKTYEFPTVAQEDVQMMQKKMMDRTLAELLVRLDQPEGQDPQERREIWSGFHQRIAFAFGCFIFVFIGMPVAVLVHRGEIVLSFALAMTTASFYYVLFVGAKTVALQTAVPAFIAFWVPNTLLLLLGTRLFRRAMAA